MANTYTPAVKLAQIGSGDRAWNTSLNQNAATLDSLTTIGDLYVSTHEQPSSSLLVDVEDGFYVTQANAIATFAGVSGAAMTLSTTNYLYLTNAGSLVINTSGFPASPNLYIPLATVVTSSSTVINITDYRTCFSVVGAGFLPLSGGTMQDGAAMAVGTTAGFQLGTTTSQKLGFFGKTPAVQPTMGAETATSSYGTNEMGMLNAVYSAIRAVGLGS